MTEGPIDVYLDELFAELRRTPARDARSLLAETEGHLRDAADEGVGRGLSPLAAETDAIRRFGSTRQVASADRQRGRIELLRGLVVSAWFLGAVGAIAIGVSGLVVAVMRMAGATNQFIAIGRPTATLSSADCARWLAGYPHAPSCAQAALDDWAAEAVGYRIAAGVIGLLALGFLALARRRPPIRRWTSLPAAVVDTIAATLFGVSGLWLAGMGIDALAVSSGHGAGQWLSAAPVALAAAVIFGIRLMRDFTPAR